MGIVLWLACGSAAFAASRMIASGRPASYAGELALGIAGALIAGLAATALDFGGWAEADWRAGLFSICVAFAAIFCSRAVRLTMRRVVER